MPFDAGYQREPVSDIIYRAAAMIARPELWCQGKMTDDAGRYCVMGAVVETIFGSAPSYQLSLWLSLSRDSTARIPTRLAEPVYLLQRADLYLNSAARHRGYGNIMYMNDRKCFFKNRRHRALLNTMHTAAVWAFKEEQRFSAPVRLPEAVGAG